MMYIHTTLDVNRFVNKPMLISMQTKNDPETDDTITSKKKTEQSASEDIMSINV